MDTKEVKYWLDEADYHVLGEPVFVATPGGTTEDDGEWVSEWVSEWASKWANERMNKEILWMKSETSANTY